MALGRLALRRGHVEGNAKLLGNTCSRYAGGRTCNNATMHMQVYNFFANEISITISVNQQYVLRTKERSPLGSTSQKLWHE